MIKKIGAELHIYLEEGTYHKRPFREPERNTNETRTTKWVPVMFIGASPCPRGRAVLPPAMMSCLPILHCVSPGRCGTSGSPKFVKTQLHLYARAFLCALVCTLSRARAPRTWRLYTHLSPMARARGAFVHTCIHTALARNATQHNATHTTLHTTHTYL